MATKPILFNTEMVRAILSGRKTQTRRAMKPQPGDQIDADWECGRKSNGDLVSLTPPCHPGDILYVRETWNGVTTGNPKVGYHTIYWYKADDKYENPADKWRPSIHMPKEAARIFLRVTDVRVERLQEITHEDVLAEGIPECPGRSNYGEECSCAEIHFADLWDSTIKPADLDRYGWAANPWVWVISFERIGKEAALGGDHDA